MNRHATGRDRDDDRGAVAVLAALSVVLLLVPAAALAADLGAVYVSEGDLQQVADVAARAGAAELAARQRDDPAPDAAAAMDATRAAARTAAVQALCAGVEDHDDWAGTCAGAADWAGDGDLANGEVSFYSGAPTTDGGFTADQTAAAGSTDPLTGVRVVTPPLRVTFGLAAAFTTDHADLQKAATAALFTVLPRYGFFPMYLAPGEVGGFCTRSAPRRTWLPTHPSGKCEPAVARGNLTAPRTRSTEDANATAWNAATGFDRDHLPLPNGTATFAPQRWTTTSLVRELAPGLFGGTGSYGAPPRLKSGACTGGYSTSSGPFSGLESAYLADFVDPAVGDRSQLRSLIMSGTTPTTTQHGWLRPEILRCGRLAAVPVLSDVVNPLPDDGLPDDARTYPVAALRLIWLDDRLWDTEPSSERVASGPCLDRGFYWADPYYPWTCLSNLRAYTGYILDPRLLPATVADTNAANTLDRFVGSGLPAAVRLLRDGS